MPEVITDTSPIQYLYQTNLLNLLPSLYNQIIMPQGVAEELAQGRSLGVALPEPDLLSWITIRPVQESPLLPSASDLGIGEREALTLALETPDSLVLLDDALARRCARQLNIIFTGTLGIILKAKQSGYIEAISPILNQLETLGFRCDLQTRAAVLNLAGE
ncbi:MAG: DUF3368 domain-containing protein [Coleofasciculus sp. D1-CHI-01]|uniref:DUF3368 domain-containing protein n=1 Tax=Coleofasciculus sp. D1-CHI-01 TaxID=3068482 RepID=UPI003303172D